ncbi:receptor-like protein EIX2 [Ziziphus jujuba]|uniref:Receptor-like protein EIX2 n=1 Tax=Ziziphus jujuba TaxID=326968 RepID=A0A6P4A1G2_ZIZJJ|nr:receptor-like protein EIX2 [Ziziphus jujuba]
MEIVTAGVPLMILVICFIIITGGFCPNTDALLMNCLESDQEALLDFKNGLYDPENRLSSWKGSNCCQWWGISCESNTGAVIAVDLHNPYPQRFHSSSRYGFWNVSGEIRPSLTKLKSLRHLDLSLNTFDGNKIPEFLGSLKNLQYLNLSNAGFSGAIPLTLGNLSGLQYLDVESWSSYVDNLEWVTGLVSLEHLVMNGVNLSMVGSDWIRTLNKLPSLTKLHLSSCSLSVTIPTPAFVNISSLVSLDLSFNKFNSKVPDWLVNISSLVTLDLSNNGLFGRIPLGFSELPNLQFLYLAGNDNLTGSCHQLLRGRWEKIHVLDIASNSLHGKLPASLGNMTFLTRLNLPGNHVEGEIPSSIGKLCNLMHFDISNNNVTGTLPEVLEGTDCLSRKPLPSLQYLDLSNNHLVGKLPEWLGQLKNLVELRLLYNSLHGPIPASLGLLQNLSVLWLGGNELNGTLPESLGQLSELIFFDVSSNHLTGLVTEKHFLKQGKLKHLLLSFNSFTLNVSSNWVPPFQVWHIQMGSCHLGPAFPAWLKSQKEVTNLDFSNASITGSMPYWFWERSSNLILLNVSHNQLEGHLSSPLSLASFAVVDFSLNFFSGSIPIPSDNIKFLDLSKNKFSGTIPKNMSYDFYVLSLSDNHINGEIPVSIANNRHLLVIDLSRNNLTGSIPSSIGNCSFLTALDLSMNNLFGKIPESLGRLKELQTLHLSDNKLSGYLPISFLNLSSLETLDLGYNRIMGRIPPWFGKGFKSLRILSLRSNSFSGELPSVLSNLSSLQVLDLAENQLNGSIPASFGDFKAMSQVQNSNHYLFYGTFDHYLLYGTRGGYYKENFVVNLEGQFRTYTKTLSLLTSLDLSGNNLSGGLPIEITKLLGLVVMNLSRNHISGYIPESISELKQLSSLDLSSNEFSGVIPRSLGLLSFLGFLNLSKNNLSGRIPYSDHLSTFDAPSFAGNLGLCGTPLAVKCPGDDEEDSDSGWTTPKDNNSGDSFVDQWFYLSIGLGFAAGILVPYIILAMRKCLREAYFGAVDVVLERILYLWLKHRTIQKRNRGHQQ